MMYSDSLAGRLQDNSARQHELADYAIVLNGLANSIAFMPPPRISDVREVGGAKAWLLLACVNFGACRETLWGNVDG